MGLPNQNNSNNLTCNTGASFQGFIFEGSNNNPSMSIVHGADTLLEISLADVFMPTDQYFCQEFAVKASSTITIDGDNILNIDGECQFIALIVTYPAKDNNSIILPTTDKYIQFMYPTFGSGTYNLGKIMILSGTTKTGSGWMVGGSPGGITIINPHNTFDVKVKMLMFN